MHISIAWSSVTCCSKPGSGSWLNERHSCLYFAGDAADRNNLEAMCHNCLAEALKELGGLEEAEAKARHGLELRTKVRREVLAQRTLANSVLGPALGAYNM